MIDESFAQLFCSYKIFTSLNIETFASKVGYESMIVKSEAK